MILMALLLIATEIGFRSNPPKEGDTKTVGKTDVGYILGAVIGLLALMLGFTFSMALDRFDVRRQLLIQETNSIGTTYLRAEVVAEPWSSEIRKLLRDYVTLRIEMRQKVLEDPKKIDWVLEQTQGLQNKLWDQAQALGRANPNQEVVSIFLDSLNGMIDLNTRRKAAYYNRVPFPIYVVLFFIAAFSMWLVGFYFKVRRRHVWLLAGLLAFMISLVIFLIMDLDQGEKGGIRVNQQSLVDLDQFIRARPL